MLCVISDSHSSSPVSTCARCCHHYFSAAFWWLVTVFNVVKTNHGAKRTQFLQITCYCKIVVCKNVEILEENHSFAFSDKLCLLHVWCHSVDLSATIKSLDPISLFKAPGYCLHRNACNHRFRKLVQFCSPSLKSNIRAAETLCGWSASLISAFDFAHNGRSHHQGPVARRAAKILVPIKFCVSKGTSNITREHEGMHCNDAYSCISGYLQST